MGWALYPTMELYRHRLSSSIWDPPSNYVEDHLLKHGH